MIGPPTNVRVLIAAKPVDFRKGAMGLAAIVEAELKADPFSGVIYVFRSKRADKIKLLFWEGTGVCLLINLNPAVGGFEVPVLRPASTIGCVMWEP